MAGAGVRSLLVDGPWRHQDIAANGSRFHVATGLATSQDRPLVLLLHGFVEFWWAWRHQIPALDEAGFSVAALDLRGYGASDKTPRGYDPQTSAADVAGVIRGLGHRAAVVVGHDWGGMAGWSVAAYAPSQLRGLVSVAAPHPLAYPWMRRWRQVAFLQLPVIAERRLMADDGAYVEWLLRDRAAPGSTFLSDNDAQRYRTALQHWPSPRCALASQRTFVRSQVRPAAAAYRRALRRRLNAPLLSVLGGQDPLVTAVDLAAVAAHLPQPHRVVTLPGVGHLPHEEAPTAFNDVLLDWLGQPSR